jgi:hypothetical protein
MIITPVAHIEKELSIIANNAFPKKSNDLLLKFNRNKNGLYVMSKETSMGHKFIVTSAVTLIDKQLGKGGDIAHYIKQIRRTKLTSKIVNALSFYFDSAHIRSNFSLKCSSNVGKLNNAFDRVFQFRYNRKADTTLRLSPRRNRAHLIKAFNSMTENMDDDQLKRVSAILCYFKYEPEYLVHKLGWSIRSIEIMDRLLIHKVRESFIKQLIEFEKIHGYKPTVFLFDDSVSNQALTFRMIVNQIAPYANVIVFAFMQEF